MVNVSFWGYWGSWLVVPFPWPVQLKDPWRPVLWHSWIIVLLWDLYYAHTGLMSFEFLLCASNITNRWNQLKSYSCGKHVFTHSSRYDIEPKQLRLPLESEILVNQFHKPIKVNISVYQWKAEWFYAFETRLSFIKISKIYYI